MTKRTDELNRTNLDLPPLTPDSKYTITVGYGLIETARQLGMSTFVPVPKGHPRFTNNNPDEEFEFHGIFDVKVNDTYADNEWSIT